MIRNISRKEFAARAGLSLRTFDQMIANGQVPTGRKIGSRRFWLEPVVDAWIIRAAGHPYPTPELPEALQAELDDALKNLRATHQDNQPMPA